MAGMVPMFRKGRFPVSPRFDELYNALDEFFVDRWPYSGNLDKTSFKVDVKEDDGGYKVLADLPGVSKDEIKIDIHDQRLTISVKREESTQQEKENYIHKERRYCSMQRTLYLEDASSENVKARLDSGVLEITVPKEQHVEKRKEIVIE